MGTRGPARRPSRAGGTAPFAFAERDGPAPAVGSCVPGPGGDGRPLCRTLLYGQRWLRHVPLAGPGRAWAQLATVMPPGVLPVSLGHRSDRRCGKQWEGPSMGVV